MAALPGRRDASAQDGAQGLLSSEGLGETPGAKGNLPQAPNGSFSHKQPLIDTRAPGLLATRYVITRASALAYGEKLTVNMC